MRKRQKAVRKGKGKAKGRVVQGKIYFVCDATPDCDRQISTTTPT